MPRKRVLSRMAGVAIVLAMAVLTMRCESQEPAPEAEAVMESSALAVENFSAVVNLIINRAQGTIRAVPPFVELCRNEAACPEDRFEWRIPGGLESGERLVIAGARQVCFPQSEWVVVPPNNGIVSGRYLERCEAEDKYGYYWPYLVTLYDGEGTVVASTDPGGIFRRGGG